MSAHVGFDLKFQWRLAPGVSLLRYGDDAVVLEVAGRDPGTVRVPHASLRDALCALVGGADEGRLLDLSGRVAAPILFSWMRRMADRRLLEVVVTRDGAPVATLLPARADSDLPRAFTAPSRVVLDRFAHLRRSPRGALLRLPGTSHDALVECSELGALAVRLAAAPVETASLEPRDLPLVQLLVALGFALGAEETETPSRRSWDFHDYLFHRATRSYDDGAPRGGTYPLAALFGSPPAIRPPHPGELQQLPAPTYGTAARRTLRSLMEERHSRRDMSAEPLGIEQLGELLYRVARVTAVLPAGDGRQECLLRPIPSAGAIHELEFYLAVRACARLAPGFYHYRGVEHGVTRMARGDAPASAMLAECAEAWGQPGRPPQALVVIASRLPRLAWKYEATAYRASLLNAGVAIEALYLVSAELGLAGCASATGSPDLFASATGTDPFEETSVAEFGVGRAG